MVGSEIDRPAERKRAPCDCRKPLIDEPVPPMASFGPRVREIKVQGGGRVVRDQVFEEIGAFEADPAQVGQTRLPPFAVKLSDSSQKPLHADEIPLGMPPGVFDKEGTIPAAQLDFQGLGARKQPGRVNPFEDGPQFIDQAWLFRFDASFS